MPRPCKRRRICAMPGAVCFGPKGIQNGDSVVTMTLDEYETIRLIDLLDQSQESCAQSMGVARTTVQAIYADARKKLARAICQGLELRIEGGSYYLCQGRSHGCCCPHCQREVACAGSQEGARAGSKGSTRAGSQEDHCADSQEVPCTVPRESAPENGLECDRESGSQCQSSYRENKEERDK